MILLPYTDTIQRQAAEWQDIATAPKDGRVIEVMHDYVGSFLMAWNPTGTNHLFAPGDIGIWEAPDRSMTWRNGEDGPSHWRPLADAVAGVDRCKGCHLPFQDCRCSDLVAAGVVTFTATAA